MGDPFVLRNYNRFVIEKNGRYCWEDFYIHRFKNEWPKLVKFTTEAEAQAFLDAHPDLEVEWDAWIVAYPERDWDDYRWRQRPWSERAPEYV